MTRPLVVLVLASQLADLATFGLAVRAQGIGGESGIGLIAPMVPVYELGGFGAVAIVKLAALALMLGILALYAARNGSSRRLALAVAAMGIFGAATNVLAIA